MTITPDCLAELIKRKPKIVFGDLPVALIEMLNKYLGLTNEDMAGLFSVTVDAIKFKRLSDKRIKQRDDGEWEEVKDVKDMTLEEKRDYADEKLANYISGEIGLRPPIYKALVAWRTDIVKELEKENKDISSEGRDLITRMLEFFRQDFIPSVRVLFKKVIINLKKEITVKVFSQLWDTFKGDENKKEDMLENALSVADKMNIDFEIADLFRDACIKNPLIKSQVDGFIEKTRKPSLVGGGIVGDKELSIKGGMQYKRQKEREERQKEREKDYEMPEDEKTL